MGESQNRLCNAVALTRAFSLTSRAGAASSDAAGAQAATAASLLQADTVLLQQSEIARDGRFDLG